MNMQEHLNRLKAKCQELLAIWDGKRGHNSIYLASCGKQAEAGWRATIAAIDELTALNDESCLYDGHEGQHTHRLRKLIAAWPEELL
jgi:hypothetical protein